MLLRGMVLQRMGGGRGRSGAPGEVIEMLDVLYIVITMLFFGLAVAYVAGCDRLAAATKASAPESGGPS
jgi:hypothetical protein